MGVQGWGVVQAPDPDAALSFRGRATGPGWVRNAPAHGAGRSRARRCRAGYDDKSIRNLLRLAIFDKCNAGFSGCAKNMIVHTYRAKLAFNMSRINATQKC